VDRPRLTDYLVRGQHPQQLTPLGHRPPGPQRPGRSLQAGRSAGRIPARRGLLRLVPGLPEGAAAWYVELGMLPADVLER
jgi:hypothetical protein